MSHIHLVSPRSFEEWFYNSPDHPGIGGSETMHCEMAWRLAARGHQVTSYAPVPPESRGQVWRGVLWRHLDDIDYTQGGVWVFVRGMEWLERFTPTPAQRVWCVFQDVDLLVPWEEAWLPKVDRIIGLCATHCEYLQDKHPTFAAKVYQSRNGLRGDLVDAVLVEPRPLRNPHRLMYASSPDRGLYGLLQAFKLIRFLVPDATVDVFYGFDNMNKLEDRGAVRWHRQRVLKAAQQPGVHLRGRAGQPTLYREWLHTGVMCAPTNFAETGYITLMEAQALGAIPIVNPIWAAKEYQRGGIAIEGDGEHDALTLRRYAMAAVHLMQHPELQEEIRGPMMAQARKDFDWEPVLDQYEQWIREDGL